MITNKIPTGCILVLLILFLFDTVWSQNTRGGEINTRENEGTTENMILQAFDSLANDTSIAIAAPINSDSLLVGSKPEEITIPYRSNTISEIHPAHSLYKDWHHEFLTPKSFSFKDIPEQYEIDLKGFAFPSHGPVTSPFGFRKPRQHYGIDLKIPMKDTIRAAFEGKVRIERYEARGYGYYIVIRHPNGLETIYGHLYKFLVKVNQYVEAGEPIALGDNTGRSSGNHLHFETRFMGNPIDPQSIIDFNSKSLLSQTYSYINPNRQISRNKKTPVIVNKT